MVQDIAYDKHYKFRFGSYTEDQEYHKITNDMEELTVNGICLGPPPKFWGIYKIFTLKTGRVVTRKQNISEITMPTWAIQHVEALTACNGRDLADGNESLFLASFTKDNRSGAGR